MSTTNKKSHKDLVVKRLSADARLPTKATSRSAGYDLYSTRHYTLLPFMIEKIPIDLTLSLPDGCYGRIAPRSGLSLRGIMVLGGVIDADYTGNVCVLLINLGSDTIKLEKGDRIAQLVLEKYSSPNVVEISEDSKIVPSNSMIAPVQREDGFGSTGK